MSNYKYITYKTIRSPNPLSNKLTIFWKYKSDKNRPFRIFVKVVDSKEKVKDFIKSKNKEDTSND